jgi:Na+/H+ antiporter NhaD/arsenite permease-like protein
VIVTVAVLSAVFSNDIVCLAVAPVLADACLRRGLDPVPFLLALACAANIGSAATLIGNPQNILIGQKLQLSFVGYAAYAIAPVGAGLAACWLLIAWQSRRRWNSVTEVAAADPDEVALNPWQTTKGLAVVAAIMLAFVFTSWPREHVALAGAGILLTSRKLHSRRMLGLVDWELLILFIGLFVVNRALERTGILPHIVDDLATAGLSLDHTGGLFGATFVLSNIVSNVPAVMLLLPVAHHPDAGPVLALASTFSGNLFIVGSIANIIVIDAALRRGIRIDWHQHARTGVPVTLATLAICAAYLWLRGSA